MTEHKTYRVGDHLFTLNIPKGMLSEKELLPYAPFQTDSSLQTNSSLQIGSSFQTSPYSEADKLFTLTLTTDAESLIAKTTPTANLEDENGKMTIFTLSDGSLTIYLTANSGYECCRLRISKDYHDAKVWIRGTLAERRYALDTTLMLLYAFASSHRNTLLLHASTIEYDEKGYLFLGKSGTGKSTHSRLWLNNIPGSNLLNDDNPIIRIIDGQCYVYGSPWSGKTPCYINRKIPVGGIVRLSQAPFNRITRLSQINAYAALLPSCSHMKWNHEMSEAVHHTLCQLLQNIPIHHLECLPNKEAALLCKTTIQAKNPSATPPSNHNIP